MLFPSFRLISVMSIADSCRTQWVQNHIQEKQAQYTDIIDIFQEESAELLYIRCNFFTDLGSCIKKEMSKPQ